MGYILVREIRQRHDQCIQICLHLAEALLQPLRLLLQFGSFLLGSLGLLFFPLFKQLPHLFGNGILLSKTGIQLSLKRFTLVVQRFDPIDSLLASTPFTAKRSRVNALFSRICLIVSMIFIFIKYSRLHNVATSDKGNKKTHPKSPENNKTIIMLQRFPACFYPFSAFLTKKPTKHPVFL